MSLAVRIIGLLDYTSLNETDTLESIRSLCSKAQTPLGPVAAVCVYPRFVGAAKGFLAESSVRVATVVNFPSGESSPESVAADVAAACADGADEIDVVFPYGAFLDQDRSRAMKVVESAKEQCGTRLLKVILESGAFTDLRALHAAAESAIMAGADFLKTSTGKISKGASLEAAQVLLSSCQSASRPVGFKASGGIRDMATAKAYLDLADKLMRSSWAAADKFRFGASALLNSVLENSTSLASGETY